MGPRIEERGSYPDSPAPRRSEVFVKEAPEAAAEAGAEICSQGQAEAEARLWQAAGRDASAHDRGDDIHVSRQGSGRAVPADVLQEIQGLHLYLKVWTWEDLRLFPVIAYLRSVRSGAGVTQDEFHSWFGAAARTPILSMQKLVSYSRTWERRRDPEGENGFTGQGGTNRTCAHLNPF